LQSLVVEAQYDEKLAEVVDAYLGSRREQAETVIRRARDLVNCGPTSTLKRWRPVLRLCLVSPLIKRVTIGDADYAA